MRWDRGGNNNEGEWPGAEPEQEIGGGMLSKCKFVVWPNARD